MNMTPTARGSYQRGDLGLRVRIVDGRGGWLGRRAQRSAHHGRRCWPRPCRIAPAPIRRSADLDYGKYKYEEQKKKTKLVRAKIIEVKEIKLARAIDDHDYQVKMRSMNKFIEEATRSR